MANDPHNDPAIDGDILHLVTENSDEVVARAYSKDVRRLRKQDLDLVAVKNLLGNIAKRQYWTVEDIRMEARLMLERLNK